MFTDCFETTNFIILFQYIGLAKAKIGKWMEELRRVQLAKDTTTITSIVSEIAKVND